MHLIVLKHQNAINVDLLQWIINILLKRTAGGDATLANKSKIKNKNISNK